MTLMINGIKVTLLCRIIRGLTRFRPQETPVMRLRCRRSRPLIQIRLRWPLLVIMTSGTVLLFGGVKNVFMTVVRRTGRYNNRRFQGTVMRVTVIRTRFSRGLWRRGAVFPVGVAWIGFIKFLMLSVTGRTIPRSWQFRRSGLPTWWHFTILLLPVIAVLLGRGMC